MSRTLFLTGGSRGIGAAIVLEAARQGWDVAFTYVRSAGLAEEVVARAAAEAPAARVRAWALDVRDSGAVDRVADEALAHFGTVTALVANAGVNHNGLAYAVTDDDWSAVIDTNLSGTFYVCRALLPELVANRHGRILAISSLTAGGASGQVAYATSKAGLRGLVATLAKEYGPKGITANTVTLGFFDTDMTREGMAEQLRDYAVRYCPLRRLGALDEVARTVLFLLGDDAGFVNAADIRVTGGLDWAP